jgi:hypothetical protein
MLNLMRNLFIPILFALFVACALSGVSLAATDNSDTVSYAARDYAFDGPSSIRAGWTTVQIMNQGHDIHHLQFIKLPPGKTVADFKTAIAANHTRMPSWVQRRSGPNGVIPGDQASATVLLDPGDYVIICGIPNRQGVPHVALGMLQAVTVAPGPQEKSKPSATDTVNLLDYNFDLISPIDAGPRTIRVVNRGSQAHELVLVQLSPGATARDFVTAFRPGVPDSSLAKPVGGIVGLDPGEEAFFSFDFKPGNYGMICFLPDLIRGSPHFALGMLLDAQVK